MNNHIYFDKKLHVMAPQNVLLVKSNQLMSNMEENHSFTNEGDDRNLIDNLNGFKVGYKLKNLIPRFNIRG